MLYFLSTLRTFCLGLFLRLILVFGLTNLVLRSLFFCNLQVQFWSSAENFWLKCFLRVGLQPFASTKQIFVYLTLCIDTALSKVYFNFAILVTFIKVVLKFFQTFIKFLFYFLFFPNFFASYFFYHLVCICQFLFVCLLVF